MLAKQGVLPVSMRLQYTTINSTANGDPRACDYWISIWAGFRSLVRIEQGKCRLISRKGNEFKSFRTLNESVLAELKVRSAVLDGEIVPD